MTLELFPSKLSFIVNNYMEHRETAQVIAIVPGVR